MTSLGRAVGPLILAFAVSATGAAASARVPELGNGDLIPPGLRPVAIDSPALQQSLSRGPAWRGFATQHRGWRALWNQATGTPHRAFGPGIPLPGFAPRPAAADRVVRAFIAGHPELFGTGPTLETLAAHPVQGLWYVRYRQTVGGVPVLFADWEFRLSADGRLFMFGADAYPTGAQVPAGPRLVAAAARTAATQGLPFDPARDQLSGEQLYLVPWRAAGRTRLRPAYQVQVRTQAPLGSWLALVDATDGTLLWRSSQIHNAITGTVTATVHPRLPTDALTTKNVAYAVVKVDTISAPTDTAGHYSANPAGSVNVTSNFTGLYVAIHRQDGNDADFSRNNVSNPSVLNIAWSGSNSDDAERDAYYHVNVAHDYIKRLDPTYTGNDVPVDCNVNIPDGECSSFWDAPTHSMNFYAERPTCPAIATLPDVIYHEYGHSVNDLLYYSEGASLGMTSGVLQEATADINAAFITDNPVFGDGFFGPGTSLRTLSNTRHWPEDKNPDDFETGLILGGAFWDLRQSAGKALAEHLVHFAKHGVPDDPDPEVALGEYFVETLVADDNDANLSNGTPHFSQIAAAFNAHGIGTNLFIDIAHTALGDQSGGGAYPVTAVVQYNGPIGVLGDVTLYASANGTPYMALPMTPTGNPDEYGAEIPRQSAAVVKYYIQATETNGGARNEPPGAPTRKLDTFLAGPASAVLAWDMETSPGWTIGATGDNATTGIWLRADPVGSIAQPEDDHTPAPGTQCFVTGNASPDAFPGVNDVDGGRTTLTTATFNALSGGIKLPVVSYYRWYSNNAGDAPYTDTWKVDISNNNGTSWVPVENTTDSDLTWRRVLFFIKDYVTPTSTMKLRFVASDLGDPSLVEAAVDDFSLLGFPTTAAVDGPLGVALGLGPAAPNPFRAQTRLRYSLPEAGAVELGVYDLMGRRVRVLASGLEPAGPHSLEWDGRDQRGRAVASGPYFVRLGFGGRTLTRAVVAMK